MNNDIFSQVVCEIRLVRRKHIKYLKYQQDNQTWYLKMRINPFTTTISDVHIMIDRANNILPNLQYQGWNWSNDIGLGRGKTPSIWLKYRQTSNINVF